ncbi:type II secretion system protein [Candidatus Saccharibacteria bacterium]|nr:type II secretion system protein [Candidatus Saccharibacteria bacterium]
MKTRPVTARQLKLGISTKFGKTPQGKQSAVGFTIVELLIVIVVIGILAAIVLNTFSGVQARARNTERATDIKAISGQLEVYYTNNNSTYPLASALDYNDTVPKTGDDVATILTGIDKNALLAPGGTGTNNIDNAQPASTVTNLYGYRAFQSDGTTNCAATPCPKYILYWTEEGVNGSAAVQKTKASLN